MSINRSIFVKKEKSNLEINFKYVYCRIDPTLESILRHYYK